MPAPKTGNAGPPVTTYFAWVVEDEDGQEAICGIEVLPSGVWILAGPDEDRIAPMGAIAAANYPGRVVKLLRFTNPEVVERRGPVEWPR